MTICYTWKSEKKSEENRALSVPLAGLEPIRLQWLQDFEGAMLNQDERLRQTAATNDG